MKLNNKGFAISSILYIILIMCIILITVTLSVLSSRKLILDKQKSDVLNSLYNEAKESKPYSPELINGLIPVVYNKNSWKVVDSDDIWYDYSNQEWANAVILKSGVTKKVGDTIDVSNEVQGMFVWIPRYEYKIDGTYGTHLDGTVGTQSLPGEIKINFILKSKTKASDGYKVHPAFTFGDEELSGIWVGKFETTGTADNPTVLPNITSLRNQNVSTQFATAQKLNTFINGDSHMAKNSEWGAVAYLSQSKYGKYGNPNYTGANKEVAINNCSSYITGIGGDTVSAEVSIDTCGTNTYETIKGQAASTTGNITGVYDMSGGAREYVMGVSFDTNGNPILGTNGTRNSGYTGVLGDKSTYNGIEPPNLKYYDIYVPTSKTTSCSNSNCFDYSLSEASGWYNDYIRFPSDNDPWLVLGGRNNTTTSAGIFYSNDGTGSNYNDCSFRIVIAPVS